MRAETSLMAARKLAGSLSHRVTMTRSCLSLLKKRSIRFLSRYRKAPKTNEPLRLLLGLITNGVAVVSFVSQQGRAWLQVRQKLLGCGAVMGLT